MDRKTQAPCALPCFWSSCVCHRHVDIHQSEVWTDAATVLRTGHGLTRQPGNEGVATRTRERQRGGQCQSVARWFTSRSRGRTLRCWPGRPLFQRSPRRRISALAILLTPRPRPRNRTPRLRPDAHQPRSTGQSLRQRAGRPEAHSSSPSARPPEVPRA